MKEFLFGIGSGHLPRRATNVAQAHGARLVNYTEPDGRKRHWFACANLGEPQNSQCAQAVLGELGLLNPTPTAGELKAAAVIATGYRKVLTALGHPDELGQLPQEIERVAKIIAENRDMSWVDPFAGEEQALVEGDKP